MTYTRDNEHSDWQGFLWREGEWLQGMYEQQEKRFEMKPNFLLFISLLFAEENQAEEKLIASDCL